MKVIVIFFSILFVGSVAHAEVVVRDRGEEGVLSEIGIRLPEVKEDPDVSHDGRFGSSCLSYSEWPSDICRISMIRLIGSPEQFDKKGIEVQGLLEVYRGSVFLFSDRDSMENSVFANSIFLGNEDLVREAFESVLGAEPVEVVGKFSARDTGPDRLRAGAMMETWSITPARKRVSDDLGLNRY